ncbi:hypothetical protein PR202_gb20001 [Eleusine coracana subsp. coracana]|uniref:Secreted protein n=1 Tax=Eleusine coracana subsp. coracana TaxID=191504 RepID=A0AAV5F9L3_ELECO|nr:hypothetical protein PR202_gb20001 [Eleusine coracana subsp. coracana]
MTFAPLLIRCLMVGMEAWMWVSSVMFYLSSRGTLRSVCRSTCFPSRSAMVRSSTVFFTIAAMTHVPRDPQGIVAWQHATTWIASHGPARWSGTVEVESNARRTARWTREREDDTAAHDIVSE